MTVDMERKVERTLPLMNSLLRRLGLYLLKDTTELLVWRFINNNQLFSVLYYTTNDPKCVGFIAPCWQKYIKSLDWISDAMMFLSVPSYRPLDTTFIGSSSIEIT